MKAARPQISPPLSELRSLEQVACRDLTVARLTLGLFGAIDGGVSRLIFPDYHWTVSDVQLFPANLAANALRVLTWGANRAADLNELSVSRARILTAIYELRQKSPYGRRRIASATYWRKKNPQTNSETINPLRRARRVRTIPILGDEIGRPLGSGTLRLVRALQPSRIEILAHGEGEHSSWRSGGVKIRLGKDGYTVTAINMSVVVAPLRRQREIHGLLDGFFETGTEGVVWSVLNDDDRGYDALNIVEEGDHLAIFDQLGNKVWAGKIRCDRKAGWRRYPLNPKYGQPCALGYWVHWTQRGFKPDDWARYFIRPEYDRLRGVLRKKRP